MYMVCVHVYICLCVCIYIHVMCMCIHIYVYILEHTKSYISKACHCNIVFGGGKGGEKPNVGQQKTG